MCCAETLPWWIRSRSPLKDSLVFRASCLLHPFLRSSDAWRPCGLSFTRRSEARTQTPPHGKEVTTHNGVYDGEALRANTRTSGSQLCWVVAWCVIHSIVSWLPLGWCGAADLWEAHSKGGSPGRVRSCEDDEHCALRQGRERAEQFGGWQRCGAEELRDELGKRTSGD